MRNVMISKNQHKCHYEIILHSNAPRAITKVEGKNAQLFRHVGLQILLLFHMKIGIKFHDIYSLLISFLFYVCDSLPFSSRYR